MRYRSEHPRRPGSPGVVLPRPRVRLHHLALSAQKAFIDPRKPSIAASAPVVAPGCQRPAGTLLVSGKETSPSDRARGRVHPGRSLPDLAMMTVPVGMAIAVLSPIGNWIEPPYQRLDSLTIARPVEMRSRACPWRIVRADAHQAVDSFISGKPTSRPGKGMPWIGEFGASRSIAGVSAVRRGTWESSGKPLSEERRHQVVELGRSGATGQIGRHGESRPCRGGCPRHSRTGCPVRPRPHRPANRRGTWPRSCRESRPPGPLRDGKPANLVDRFGMRRPSSTSKSAPGQRAAPGSRKNRRAVAERPRMPECGRRG